MRIVHVISGLGVGGAETMLARLVSSFDPEVVESSVISLSDKVGPAVDQIRGAGAHLEILGMKRTDVLRFRFGALLRLRRILREVDPDLVQTWLYHADVLGGLAARLAGYRVVWSLRQSDTSISVDRFTTSSIIWLAARLSGRIPMHIISGSQAALRAHVASGYPASRMTVIPNGFDTSVFRPDETNRDDVRRELEIESPSRVVGLVARFDPEKDHETFIRAAGLLAGSGRDVVFVLCGLGIDRENERLGAWITDQGISSQTRLLGLRRDVARLLRAFDVAVLSSTSEGLPNVVGEAMSTGVPCVVTDVGDTHSMVGDTGIVVPIGRADLLAEAVAVLLDETAAERQARGRAARRRIESQYSLPASAESHLKLWSELSASGGRVAPPISATDATSRRRQS